MASRKVRLVTDSSADLPPSAIEQLGITVVPLEIQWGKERFREGIDITPRDFFRRVSKAAKSRRPKALPPAPEAFHSAFAELAKEGGDIFALHLSSKLSRTFKVAKEVAGSLLGQTRIIVMDSQTTSLGLGTLVIAAAAASARGASLDDLVRLVRGMTPHLYLVLFIENLDYLQQEKRIAKAHAILGTMLGIKPLFILEDGDIVPMEKVSSRGKAVERLFEFITEFPHIEDMTVLHGSDGTDLAELLERLEEAFPGKEIKALPYTPSLATHVGPGAIGVFIYEGMD